ncbi:hypothetical protein SL053_000065 [Flavobacterium psychrophilum]|nr:hypothetical protein [Flavobacterium psychrophilum]
MSDFNIKEVDFYNLDLEKYIDWLLMRYELFSTIYQLAYFDELIDDLHIRKYFASSHYLMTRAKELPKPIEKAYNDKINYFETQRTKYKGLHIELIFFKSISIDKDFKDKKYTYFSCQELKEIKIDTRWLNFWVVENKDYFNDLVDEINNKKDSSALSDITFYQKEKDKIISNFEFIYLPSIIEGHFIYNLDNESNALAFSSEIEKMKLLIYLSEKTQGNSPKHPLIKPIQWNGNINALVTIFHTLKESKIIESTDENIKRMLTNCFIDSEQKELSKHYLNEIFTKSKGKLNSQVIEKIAPLVSVLNKNSPKD